MKDKKYDRKLIEEFDLDKNGCSIYDFPITVRDKAWWHCSTCGYEWQATLASRKRGKGCPCCAGHILLPGTNDLLSQYPDIASGWSDKNDKASDQVFAHAGTKAWWHCSTCGMDYKATVCDRTRKDRPTSCPYCNGRKVSGDNSLAARYPDIALDWDHDKNVKSPDDYTARSNQKVFWKCHICGCEWGTTIVSRTTGCGCPHCAGRVPLQGYDDLCTLYPDLSVQIIDVDPATLTAHSGRIVKWKCPVCGHTWKATVASRVNGAGCPVCTHHTYKQGETDLASAFPNLLKDWDENNVIKPDKVSANSHNLAIWRCPKCGKRWTAPIANRTSLMNGCPYCNK